MSATMIDRFQTSLFQLHCNRPMHGHGTDQGRSRYRCNMCGCVLVDQPKNSRRQIGERFTVNSRNAIYLGLDCVMSNSDGWQYAYRATVAEAIGRSLRANEQVDHTDGDKLNDCLRNLRLLLDTDHGKYHYWAPGRYLVLGEWLPEVGEFVEYSEPREVT